MYANNTLKQADNPNLASDSRVNSSRPIHIYSDDNDESVYLKYNPQHGKRV